MPIDRLPPTSAPDFPYIIKKMSVCLLFPPGRQSSYADVLNHWYLEVVNDLGRAEFEFQLEPKPVEPEEMAEVRRSVWAF